VVVLELDIPPLKTNINQCFLNGHVNLHEKIRVYIDLSEEQLNSERHFMFSTVILYDMEDLGS